MRYGEFAVMSDALQMRAPEKCANENCASSGIPITIARFRRTYSIDGVYLIFCLCYKIILMSIYFLLSAKESKVFDCELKVSKVKSKTEPNPTCN